MLVTLLLSAIVVIVAFYQRVLMRSLHEVHKRLRELHPWPRTFHEEYTRRLEQRLEMLETTCTNGHPIKFVPALQFLGYRKNYEFKTGAQGTGYYFQTASNSSAESTSVN